MEHPWRLLIEAIKDRGWTQKQFSSFVWKKNSEVNELIKGKRNITVQWDLILSKILWTPEKYWINLQVDYDYNLAKIKYEEDQNNMDQDIPVIVWSDWNEISDWENQDDVVETNALPENIQSVDGQWDVWVQQSSTDSQTSTQDSLEQERRRELNKIWRDF